MQLNIQQLKAVARVRLLQLLTYTCQRDTTRQELLESLACRISKRYRQSYNTLTDKSYCERPHAQKLRVVRFETKLANDRRQEKGKPKEICASHEVDDGGNENMRRDKDGENLFNAECIQRVHKGGIFLKTLYYQSIKNLVKDEG